MKILKLALVILVVSLASCSPKETKPKVTFIELGSVKCKPCIRMQGVIKQIEAKYKQDKVKTVFYDVWTKELEHYADDYHIESIPTQVFLDADGKEYFRHEGFFEFDALDKIIQKGLED